MQSIIQEFRRTIGCQLQADKAGAECGRHWASENATVEELCRLSALASNPNFERFFEESLITSERLVAIIDGNSDVVRSRCVEFWNDQFGDSDDHALTWRDPAFARAFVKAAAEAWTHSR